MIHIYIHPTRVTSTIKLYDAQSSLLYDECIYCTLFEILHTLIATLMTVNIYIQFLMNNSIIQPPQQINLCVLYSKCHKTKIYFLAQITTIRTNVSDTRHKQLLLYNDGYRGLLLDTGVTDMTDESQVTSSLSFWPSDGRQCCCHVPSPCDGASRRQSHYVVECGRCKSADRMVEENINNNSTVYIDNSRATNTCSGVYRRTCTSKWSPVCKICL